MAHHLCAGCVCLIFALPRNAQLQQKRREGGNEDHNERSEAAPFALVAAAAPAAKDHRPFTHRRNPGDRSRNCRCNRRSQNVVVADVREFMRNHAFELIVIHQLHQSLRYGHGCVTRVPARRKGIRCGLRNHVKLWHRQIRFCRESFHHGIKPRLLLTADRLRSAGHQRDLVREEIRAPVHDNRENQRDRHATASAKRPTDEQQQQGKRRQQKRSLDRFHLCILLALHPLAPHQAAPALTASRLNVISPVFASASTSTSSPLWTSPSIIRSASGSCISFWIARFIGRAPKAGSNPSLKSSAFAAAVRCNLICRSASSFVTCCICKSTIRSIWSL